ncbi:hypothetical protein R1flu_008377 [Riccia fluitans]|uniref:Uncharacterized protein n=1 Tax=Riccia fluitans TaxID=41844 RepID=A0ABD1YBK4_9MARC
MKKMVTRQVKALGVYNEPTCLGPYLVHLYHHFHEMNNKKMEEPKKQKARKQTVSDLETEMEEEKKMKEFPNAMWIGETSKTEKAATNLERSFTPPPAMEAMDIQLWKEMVQNLVSLLMGERKRNQEVVEQREFFEGKVR